MTVHCAFWNTGSWIYEPALGSPSSYERYLRHGWPGTAVLIDTDRDSPELVELLGDLNPLTRFEDARQAYVAMARFRGTIPALEQVQDAGA